MDPECVAVLEASWHANLAFFRQQQEPLAAAIPSAQANHQQRGVSGPGSPETWPEFAAV